MKILFVPTLNSPVVFYRMENFVKYLRRMGHEVAFTYWGPNFGLSCFWEKEMKEEFIEEINELVFQSDIVVFQGIHTQKAIALILALQDAYKQPILAEYDDNPYAINSGSPNFQLVGPGTNVELWGDEQIRKSHGVIVSTDYLKKIFAPKNSKIFVIPNSIDFEIWDKLKSKKKGKYIKIGWEGGAGHQINLRLIKNVVPKILFEFPNVVFHFRYGGYEIPYLNHKRIIFEDYHKWTNINDYPQELKFMNSDINIAPLRDLEFNRAKSNLRWLEGSALKIPTVASDVESYRCIEHGETGFLVKEEDEWYGCLKKLIQSEELRKHIGKMAYQKVKKDYNVEITSKTYLDTLKSFL
jgi:glycosyltransferase involved in cell wall biosynthesis